VLNKPPSQRQLRVSEMLRKALSEVFVRTDIADADLKGTVLTVSEVRVSPDLKNAIVYLLPLGGRNQDAVLAALNRHKRFVRGELARKVELRYMPDVTFELDRTFDRTGRLNELLRSPEVARDIE
jgi:ribosome-binding factor A